MKLNITQAYCFNSILDKSDIPYDFNLKKNYWWRWYSEIFGFYYNRVKRTFCVWVTTFLKKNLDIKMPFFFSIIDKNCQPLNKYKNYIFLYNFSLNNVRISKLKFLLINKNFNFEVTNFYLLSESAKFILYPKNKKHRSIGTYGILDRELDMFFSSYNANWNSLYNKQSIYKQAKRLSKSFIMVINNYNFNTSFFINSFDSILNLYPQFYLNYIKLLNYKNKINQLFKLNAKFVNIDSYKNLITYYIKFLYKSVHNNFLSFINNKLYKNNFIIKFLKIKSSTNIYKLNNFLYLKFINNLKFKKYLIFVKTYIQFKTINIVFKNYFDSFDKKKYLNKLYCIKIIFNLINKNRILKKKLDFNFFNTLYKNEIKLNLLKNKIYEKLYTYLISFNKKNNYFFNYFSLSRLKNNNKILIKFKWVTKFKKYFNKIFFFKKNLIINNNSKNTMKILWYLKYDEKFNIKVKNFVSRIIYLLFNISTKIIFFNYCNFITNLKYNLVINYLFIIKYIRFNCLKDNFYFTNIEKFFFQLIRNFKCFNKFKTFKSNVKINKLSYLQYL